MMMIKVRGSTLTEIFIVVAVLAVLAVIAVPNYRDAQTKSKISQVRDDQRAIAMALEAYCLDSGVFPPMADVGYGASINSPGFHSRLPSYLTTPVAYLPEILYDPFVGNDFWNSSVYPIESNVGSRYVYFNYPVFLSEFPSSSFRERYDIAGDWLIYSVGPDHDPFNIDSIYMNYDPTNGVISSGNIFYTQKNPEKYSTRH